VVEHQLPQIKAVVEMALLVLEMVLAERQIQAVGVALLAIMLLLGEQVAQAALES
jgi:hypothetical protein